MSVNWWRYFFFYTYIILNRPLICVFRLREAEGRKPGMSKQGIEEESESDSSDDDDDDSDDEESNKKPAVKKPSPAQLSIAAKKRAAAAGDDEKVESKSAGKDSSGPEKLKPMDIKKMNGESLKEHLKDRKLDLQGQKKDLIQRLLDYEAARA